MCTYIFSNDVFVNSCCCSLDVDINVNTDNKIESLFYLERTVKNSEHMLPLIDKFITKTVFNNQATTVVYCTLFY